MRRGSDPREFFNGCSLRLAGVGGDDQMTPGGGEPVFGLVKRVAENEEVDGGATELALWSAPVGVLEHQPGERGGRG